MKKHQHIWVGILILLIAVFFRLWMYDSVPPGLQHDEIFKAEEGVRFIENGDFRLFYPSNQGHEGAFVWLLGLSHLLFGINTLMIKYPAFVCGILTVALIYRLGCKAYSIQVGVLASGLTAVSFWAVFASRVGLRAVMLPVVVLAVLIGLNALLKTKSNQRIWRTTFLTGFALGIAIYTYTSSFALHISFALFFVTLAIVRKDIFIRRWKQLLLIGIMGALLSLPMIHIRITDPQGDNRVNSITTPLQEAQAGNPQILIDNAFKLAGMPAFVGDPTWRYNVSGRPLFLLPIGLLVYFGFVSSIIHIRRNPLNIMVLGLSIFGLIPSLLTVLAPSFLRSIIVLPSIMLFIGIAVWQICKLFQLHAWISWGLIAGIITVTAIVDYQAYFINWAASQNPNLTYHDEMEQGATVYEIYRDDLQQLARYLSNVDETLVFVSTPDSELDPIIYKFSGAPSQSKTHVVFFDAFANIVLSESPTLLFVSPLSSISEKHRNWLTEEYGTEHIDQILREDGKLAFDVYRISATGNNLQGTLDLASKEQTYILIDGEKQALEFPINFGDLILFRGLEIPRKTVEGENDGVNNQLYFEPLVKSSGATINIFLHLVNDQNEILAQRDLLGVPPAYWHPDTIFVQDNFVPFWEPVPADTYQLVLGVYDWQTGVRIPILDQNRNTLSDSVIVGEIEVINPTR